MKKALFALILVAGCSSDPTYSPELDNAMTLKPITDPDLPYRLLLEPLPLHGVYVDTLSTPEIKVAPPPPPNWQEQENR